MFVACTLLPIAALFVLSFRQVTRQLDVQSQKHLNQSVKTHSSMVRERLLHLETDLRIIASILDNDKDFDIDADHSSRLIKQFEGIVISTPSGAVQTIMGTGFQPLELNDAEWTHIRAGNTVIRSQPDNNHRPRILMIRLSQSKHRSPYRLSAEIRPEFLWTNNGRNALAPDLDFCVFDDHHTLLFSTFDITPELTGKLLTAPVDRDTRLSRIQHKDDSLKICNWVMMLKSRFLGPRWTIMVVQPESAGMWPIAQFRYLFILVAIMTFLVVLLLSINMIRRSLTPLERLKESTRRIARKDFSGHLEIRSGDEFEELAEAFNNMSEQLNRQFNTLVAKSEIDRAILSSIETEKIVKAVLTGMRSCFSYDAISIALLDSSMDQPAQIFMGAGSQDKDIRSTRLHIPEKHLVAFDDFPEYLFFESDHDLPAYLESMGTATCSTFLVLPIYLKKKLTAIITFGFRLQEPHDREDIRLARQMADQVAVALANSQLMDELNRLNWGTIKALARAVDAKSSWTAGHSERVAAMAVSLGTAMRLMPADIEDLKRAALLHDIGKLGVPAAVLDKPGKLTAEEYLIVQRHPSLGASILQPINAYADIISMVRHHHENFDGSGYPDGLVGEEIEVGARILAVADVFDALKSDRPYRQGLPLANVIDFMQTESRRQFDPQVVDALIEILRQESASDKPVAVNVPDRLPVPGPRPQQRESSHRSNGPPSSTFPN